MELTTSGLLEEYKELVNDEELMVRSAALSNLFLLLEKREIKNSKSGKTNNDHIFSENAIVSTIIPMVRKLSNEKANTEILVKILAHFMWTIHKFMTADDAENFVIWYQKCATSKDSEIRKACAYNLPVIFIKITTGTFQVCNAIRTNSHLRE
jgi:hypothetical protein